MLRHFWQGHQTSSENAEDSLAGLVILVCTSKYVWADDGGAAHSEKPQAVKEDLDCSDQGMSSSLNLVLGAVTKP
eukprot:1256316-Rhodomonas_salina.1